MGHYNLSSSWRDLPLRSHSPHTHCTRRESIALQSYQSAMGYSLMSPDTLPPDEIEIGSVDVGCDGITREGV